MGIQRILKIFKIHRYYCNYPGGEEGYWKEGRGKERTEQRQKGSYRKRFCYRLAHQGEKAKGVIVNSSQQMAPEVQR